MTTIVLNYKKKHEVDDIILDSKLGKVRIKTAKVSKYKKDMFDSFDDILKFVYDSSLQILDELYDELQHRYENILDSETLHRIFDNADLDISFIWKREENMAGNWYGNGIIRGILTTFVDFGFVFSSFYKKFTVGISKASIYKPILTDYNFPGVKVYSKYKDDKRLYMFCNEACIHLSKNTAICIETMDFDELLKSTIQLSTVYSVYKHYIEYLSNNVNFEKTYIATLPRPFDPVDVIVKAISIVSYQLIFENIKDLLRDYIDEDYAKRYVEEYYSTKKNEIAMLMLQKDKHMLFDFITNNLDKLTEYVRYELSPKTFDEEYILCDEDY